MVASLVPVAVNPIPAKEVSAKAAPGGVTGPDDFSTVLALATGQDQTSAATTIPMTSPKSGKNLSLASGNQTTSSVHDKATNKGSAQNANSAPLDVSSQNLPLSVQPAPITVPVQTAEATGSDSDSAFASAIEVNSTQLAGAVVTSPSSFSAQASLQVGVVSAVAPPSVTPATEGIGAPGVSSAKDPAGDAPDQQTESAVQSDIQPQSLTMQAVQPREMSKVQLQPKVAVPPSSSKQDAKVGKLESNADSKAGTAGDVSSAVHKPDVSSSKAATDNNAQISTASKAGSHRQSAGLTERQSEQSTEVTTVAPAPVSGTDAPSALPTPKQMATKDTGAGAMILAGGAAVTGVNLSSALGTSPLSAPSKGSSASTSTTTQSSQNSISASIAGAATGSDNIHSASEAAPSAEMIAVQVASASAGSKHESSTQVFKSNAHAADTASPSAQASAQMDKQIDAAPAYTSLLQSAKLTQRLGEAELHVGIHSGEFGNVDIRTSMAHNQFTAQISVERNELGRVMAAELPNLQSKLSEQRLSSANITLQNPSTDSGSASSQQGSRQGQNLPRAVVPQAAEAVSAPVQSMYPVASATSARLDVHM